MILRTIFFTAVVYNVMSIEMYIELEDNQGHRQKYNISEELEELLREEPPFRVPAAGMEKDYTAKMRPRRETHMLASFPFSRRLPKCERFMEEYRRTNKQPIQLTYLVDEYEDIRMTCHYCGDNELYGQTIEWKRALRQKLEDSYFKIETVPLDRHDDETKNRVFIDEEFNLHIKNTTMDDIGTYFCHSMRTDDTFVKDRLNMNDLRNFFQVADRFRLFYNVDVIFKTDVPVRRIGENSPHGLPSLGEIPSHEDNLKYFTSWGEWTECSVCGEQGEKRQRGTCMANLLNKNYMIHGWEHIYYVLLANQMGVPCRSSLFYGYTKMTGRERPDELKVEKCHVKCVKGIGVGQKFATVKLKRIEFLGLKKKVPERYTRVIEGNRIDLTCPRSTIDTLVYWMNGTKYMTSIKIREATNMRVDIDAYNVFVIHSALMQDAGTYTCWFAGRRQMMFSLKVLPPPGLPPWVQHLIYVCYGFTVDFWVFVVLIVIRHKHRLVAHTKTKKAAKKQTYLETIKEQKMDEEEIVLLSDESDMSD